MHERTPGGVTTGDLVQQLRQLEYRQRVERLREGIHQELLPRRHLSSHPHVVYVMTNVQVSGGARIILEHANRLHRSGFRVTVVAHFPKPDWYPVECEYRQVPFQSELAQGIPDCDVIVATYWDHIHACIETGIAPVVYFEQGDFHLFEKTSDDRAAIIKAQIESTDLVTTVSDPVARIMKEKYGRTARVFPNAVDRGLFSPQGQDDHSGLTQRPYIMMMGSDRQAFKGTADVQQAYQLVRESGVEVDLVWVAPESPVAPFGDVYVRPSQNKLATLYRNALLFVSGSHYESFSLPVLEAMASGCPVVSTANAGVLHYAQDEYNCLLVPVGDVNALAAQIIRLVRTPDLRSRLRTNGLATAQTLHWDDIVAQLRAYYSEVAHLAPKGPGEPAEWSVLLPNAEHLTGDGQARLEKRLLTTKANVVQVPVIYDAFEGHQIARWETITRRNRTGEGGVERLFVPVRGREPKVPYLTALKRFQAQDYRRALMEFMRHFKQSSRWDEKVIYLRWIVLCLLEQGQDQKASELLSEALTLSPANTDLIYLQAQTAMLSGNPARGIELYKRILIIGENTRADEFFYDLREVIQSHMFQTSSQ